MHMLHTSETDLLHKIDMTKTCIGFCTDQQKKSPTSTFKSYLLIAEEIAKHGYHSIFIFLGIDMESYDGIQSLLEKTTLEEYSILSLPAADTLRLRSLTNLELMFVTEQFNRTLHQLPAGIKLATSVHSRNHSCTYKNGLLYYFFNNFDQFNNRIINYPKGRFDYHFIDNKAHLAELGYLQRMFQAITAKEQSGDSWTEKMCFGYIRGEAYNIARKDDAGKVILFAPVGTLMRQDWFSDEEFIELLCSNFPDYEIWYRVALNFRNDRYHQEVFRNLAAKKIPNLVFDERAQTDNIAEVYASAIMLVTDASEAALSFTISQQRPTLHCTKGRIRVPGSALTDNYADAISKTREILNNLAAYGKAQYEELLTEIRPLGQTVEYIAANIEKLVDGGDIPESLDYVSQDPIKEIDYSDNEMIDRFINFCIENGGSEGGIDKKFYEKCASMHQTYPPDHPYNAWFVRTLQSPLYSWMEKSPQHQLFYKVFLIRASFWAGRIEQAKRLFTEVFNAASNTAVAPPWLGGKWEGEELKHFIPVLLHESDKWGLTEYQKLCQELLSIISQTAEPTQISRLFSALAELTKR